MVQIVFGGFMAGIKAGVFYPSFPLMNGHWIPEAIFEYRPWWRNLFENPAMVQFIHRGFAYLLSIGIIWMWIREIRNSVGGMESLAIHAMSILVLIQVALGIITLLQSQGSVPVLWGILHQGGAMALFSTTVFLNHRFINQTAVINR